VNTLSIFLSAIVSCASTEFVHRGIHFIGHALSRQACPFLFNSPWSTRTDQDVQTNLLCFIDS